jgi:predicted membrane-bound spermidine synthase
MRLTIFFLFILSGFAGLVYQSIWSHYLGLFLGHSAYAQTVVLVVFMGGLALGAWLASLYSHKIRSVLLGYALIEGIIGLLGLVFDPAFKGFLTLSLESIIPALPANWVDTYRFTSASLLIFPQTILLGMTFPLMTAVFLRYKPEKSGKNLGLLYFTNSLGAAIGALASVFLLMPALGLPGTIFTAGLLNIAIALVAYGIAKYADFADLPAAKTNSEDKPAAASFWLFAALILFAAFFTGLASFIYEIAWIRLLSLVFGSTMYAFEIMLSAFIAGLAFGGLWIRGRLDAMQKPLLWAGSIQILMGVFAISTLWLYSQSFEWMKFILESVQRNDGGFALFSIFSHGIALLIMFPATFFAGMTLPLFTQALLQRGGRENSVGQVYAINTVGAIIGVLLAVHWLMPSYGLKMLLAVGAGLDILLGIVLLIAAKPGQQALRFVAASLLGLGIWTGMVYHVDLDPRQMSSGVFRYARTDIGEQSNVVFLRDGKTATVAVTQTPQADSQSIMTNGKPDAALRRFIAVPESESAENFTIAPPASDETTMVLLGALGPAYFPEAKSAAVIGFGSGLSTQVLLGFDSIEKVETIEIEPMMIEGAKQFLPRNRRAYEDPRSLLVIDDAKAFFAKTGNRYDLIISEPSNPWVSGVGTLFSQEFYQNIGRSLTDNGLLVQWMHVYELNDGLLASVFKGLSAHFADYEVLMANGGDLVIIASKNRQVPLLSDFPWQQEKVLPELTAVGLDQKILAEARIVGNKATLDAWFQDFGIAANSDFYPLLSLQAPKSLFFKEGAQGLENILKAAIPVQEMLGGHPGLALPWSVAPDAFLTYRGELLIARDFYQQLKHPEGEKTALIHDLRYVPYLVQQHCRDFVNETDWLENLLVLAQFTLLYLPENERLDLWEDLNWQNCPNPSEKVKDWNALYQAVAQRDALPMWNLAQKLMPDALASSNTQAIRYLLDAALVGALVSGQSPAARTWLETTIKGQLASISASNRLLMALVLQQR